MKLILAPMEGLVDAQMRDLLTRIGGIDRCVTEFVRVSDRVLPPKVFYRIAPELRDGGKTPSGVPVSIQLLGSDLGALAGNAIRAVKLGAPAIDLNFGCPSKTVNKNKGGSILLREPNLIHLIVKSVRDAVPAHVPVTAKMRLGYEDKSLALDNAFAIQEGGASEVCVHARTKVEGYKPPAHWEWISRIREALDINVLANGDVCSLADYQRCREISGCEDVMIGRGLIARPDLALIIAAKNRGGAYGPMAWDHVFPLVQGLFQEARNQASPKHAPGRLKQWLSFLKHQYPEAQVLFDQVRGVSDHESLSDILGRHLMKNTG